MKFGPSMSIFIIVYFMENIISEIFDSDFSIQKEIGNLKKLKQIQN